jgi:predicted ATPase
LNEYLDTLASRRLIATNPMSDRIVITGAPASGKTLFFERLKADPAFARFRFLDELARQLLIENPEFRQDWGAFHREIYRRQMKREDALAGASFVTDRGTVDTFAFHPESMAEVGTTMEREYRRYSLVVQLGSAAGLGFPHYVCDDIRNETIEQALNIEAAVRTAWQQHPGYHFLEAEVDLEEKYDRFRALLVRNVVER